MSHIASFSCGETQYLRSAVSISNQVKVLIKSVRNCMDQSRFWFRDHPFMGVAREFTTQMR